MAHETWGKLWPKHWSSIAELLPRFFDGEDLLYPGSKVLPAEAVSVMGSETGESQAAPHSLYPLLDTALRHISDGHGIDSQHLISVDEGRLSHPARHDVLLDIYAYRPSVKRMGLREWDAAAVRGGYVVDRIGWRASGPEAISRRLAALIGTYDSEGRSRIFHVKMGTGFDELLKGVNERLILAR